MSKQSKRAGFTPQDNLVSILPAVIAGIFVLDIIVIMSILQTPPPNNSTRNILILYGTLGSLYLAFYYLLYAASPNKLRFGWINAVIAGVALGVMTFLVPENFDHVLYTLVFIAALSTSVISQRGPAYLLVIIFTLIHIFRYFIEAAALQQWLIHSSITLAAFMAVETIQQLRDLSKRQINRLEIVNEISRQIISTLETKQLLALINAALENALNADTYYIGIMDGENIHMQLFYDEGEYYNDILVKKEGALSGWVIDNQKTLFLPDLRKPIDLEGVDTVIIGKQKASLSWMGIPMKGTHVNGVMVIASYHPNAFDKSDLELLSNIAQRAALALDNTYNHALVQEEARLDSLTRVYNHGSFIKNLREKAEECQLQKKPLSLIMLDIDYFKEYNDKFGHQAGDEILVKLCKVIRDHIKSTDAVGRWGGEEFSIALANTDGSQAIQVAQRIRKSMESLKLQTTDLREIPAPTVSMGVAVFPNEKKFVNELIDLADSRLYIAKERGRDQVEPAPAFFENDPSN